MPEKIKTVYEKKRIESLQALRAFSFLGIFLSHAGSPVSWPALGVSVFFVLSGFLMSYTYHDRDMTASVRNNLRFAISKIKKLYKLHIITMCCMLLIELITGSYYEVPLHIGVLIGEIILNLTLLQAWIPHIDTVISLNGVAWFLSATFLLYFMFPFIKKWIRNVSNIMLMILSTAILGVQIISCMLMIYVAGVESDIYSWFMYYFPVFRLGDFFVGCCLGKYYKQNTFSNCTNICKYKWSVFEIIFVVITYKLLIWCYAGGESILAVAIRNYATVNIVLAAGWVYLFAVNGGIVTKLCVNRVSVFLGNISSQLFLIHVVVLYAITYFWAIHHLIMPKVKTEYMILFELLLTIAAAWLSSRKGKKS